MVNWREQIASDPNVMMGKPVVKGTRITVELIFEKLGAGETIDQIISEHPRLTEGSVRAALAFAAESLRADVVYPSDRPIDEICRPRQFRQPAPGASKGRYSSSSGVHPLLFAA